MRIPPLALQLNFENNFDLLPIFKKGTKKLTAQPYDQFFRSFNSGDRLISEPNCSTFCFTSNLEALFQCIISCYYAF